MTPVTLFEVAQARGMVESDGGYTLGAFDAVGIPMIGGCEVCGACVAAYNACPSTSGNIRCAAGCIDDRGFPSVKAFEAWSAYQDALREAEGPQEEQCSDCGCYVTSDDPAQHAEQCSRTSE